MKTEQIYVVVGATLHEAGAWAKRNNVPIRDVVAVRRKEDCDRLRGIHGTPVTFVGRDKWWVSQGIDRVLQEMQLLTMMGEAVRFITDESPIDESSAAAGGKGGA